KYGYATNYTEIKYKLKANHKLTITPKLNFNVQTPWEKNTPYEKALIGNPKTADSLAIGVARFKFGLNFIYDLNHRINIVAGLDAFTDKARNADTLSRIYRNKAPEQYSNTAFYGQTIFRLTPFNLFVGARYETSSLYSPAFSPRLGITKKFRRSHFKLLLSDAYRLPTLGNIFYSFDGTYDILPDSSGIYNLGRGLKPEKTLFIEAEFGYQFGSKVFLTANIFDITTRDPIVYTYFQDKTIREVFGYTEGILAYQNFDRSGTRGFELDFLFKDHWGYLNANYSYYTTRGKPRISAYSVSTFNRDPLLREEADDSQLLAFPSHKMNINWCYYIRDNMTVNVTSTLLWPRYGYDVDIYGPGIWDVDGKLVKKRFSAYLNAYFKYNNLFTEGLDAGIGVYDLFNQGVEYLQPYFGMQPVMPGPSREIYMKLSYSLPFNKKKSSK
ncbi:MAG: TonB-dependent receptor, partial [Bacteroidales bacterium]|nr:TonB-dependent receptor [Bacteroidales bacterium]